jgi:hypothetical protein
MAELSKRVSIIIHNLKVEVLEDDLEEKDL